jgi:EH_Signature domain
MMTALSHLRAALRDTNSDSSRGLTFDTRLLDQETSKLRAWLGDRGTAKLPQDAIVGSLHAFHHDQYLGNRRQALLVCFGCIEPVLISSSRLIEDGERFPKLLRAVDAYIQTPRAYRPCYRGLVNAYFGYDPETARSAGKQNWEGLWAYLRERAANTIAPGLLPSWVEALQANTDLLGDDPGSAYGKTLFAGHSDEFDHAREALDIHENSWLIWRLVLGQVEAAAHEDDTNFQTPLWLA